MSARKQFQEAKSRAVGGSHQCVIHDFSSHIMSIKKDGKKLTLPFSLGNLQCAIEICQDGIPDVKNLMISLKVSGKPTGKIRSELSIVLSGHKKHSDIKYKNTIQCEFNTEGWSSIWIDYDTIQNEVLKFSNDQLTLLCEIYELHISETAALLKKFHSTESFFNSERLSDVRMIAGGKTLFAHKMILSGASDVFAAMFQHNTTENSENIIRVRDIKYEVILEMMRFIYTGEVRGLNEMVAKKLLIAADKYNVVDLKFICGEYLAKGLTPDNTMYYIRFADRHQADPLKDAAIRFFTKEKFEIVYCLNFESALKKMDHSLIVELFRNL